MANSSPRVLRTAEFDPKLKHYLALSPCIPFVLSIVLIPLVPLWLLFAYAWWAPKHFEALSCVLTERALLIRRGIVFKTEKTVPLDKIQDLALKHGPILNAFGISSITVETAGQSGGGAGQGDAVLQGIIDARDFRDAVMAQRDGERPSSVPAAPVASDEAETARLLVEIRDTLMRIEEKFGATDRS